MELKLPPGLVFLLHSLMVWIIGKSLKIGAFDFTGQRELTQVLGTAGVALAMVAIATFRRARTTINPIAPAKVTDLVTSGIYGITRNPMYLALLLILLAWVVLLENTISFLLAGTFVWYLTKFQIRPEERVLEEKFGDRYRQYKQKVRRWI